jgi:hypothetical protein
MDNYEKLPLWTGIEKEEYAWFDDALGGFVADIKSGLTTINTSARRPEKHYYLSLCMNHDAFEVVFGGEIIKDTLAYSPVRITQWQIKILDPVKALDAIKAYRALVRL